MKIYCPRCGQEQISTETRFCSRCGFLMAGLSEIVFNGGVTEQLQSKGEKQISPRRKGLKQGGAWFLLGIFVVSLLAVLSEIFNFRDEIVGLAAVIFFLGGLLRMIYALIFESGNPTDKTLEENVLQTAQQLLNKKPQANALPPTQSIPASDYIHPTAGNWRDTNDLTPTSVTDATTKLLQKDE